MGGERQCKFVSLVGIYPSSNVAWLMLCFERLCNGSPLGTEICRWISVGSDLKFDARRDLDDVGATCIEGKYLKHQI